LKTPLVKEKIEQWISNWENLRLKMISHNLKIRLIMTLYSFMNFFVRTKSEHLSFAKRELFNTKRLKKHWIFSRRFAHIEMHMRHTWKMKYQYVIMLMRSHCKTKPRIKLRKIKLKRARIKRIIPWIREITPQKREQGNVYAKTFMNLKNVHTLSHQQESLIEQKIKRYANKSNNDFRKNPEFWRLLKEFAISTFWTK
jgi:hypothetical protein